MSASLGPPSSKPALQPDADPAGFAERGAIVAFTTPQLFGARLPRPRAGAPPDLILANLSGQPGNNVLPGAKLLATPGLTAHDQALWQKLRELTDFAPEKIRGAMITIAAEGWRGRAAAACAEEQSTADITTLRRMFFLLLTDLIRRTELPAEAKVPPEQESLIYLRPRIGKAVARIAKRYSMTTEAVEAAIEALASVFMPLGKHNDTVTGHTRAAMAELQSFIKELDQWLAPRRDNARGLRAEFLLRKAKLALICTQAAINELDRVLDDTTILLRAWQRDQASVLRRASRPQWLLDGWDIIIALWRQSEPSDREACFWEMSHLVPILPKEVEGWSAFPEGASKIRQEQAISIKGTDWRRFRPLEFIARNETLLTGKHGASLAAEARKLREAYLVQSTRSLTQGAHDPKDGEDTLSRISKRTSMASDSVLQQVVAVLEAVPSRAMLDPIIETARPRLKLLRPPRPITFARILFLPFDGAVVPLKEWSMGSAKLPRPALMPISEAIQTAMGPEAEKISANLGGRSFFDVLQVDSEGRTLWAEAARLAPTLSFPKGLPAAGLDAAQSRQLLELAAGIWRHADGIWEAKLACFSGPSSELVAAALKGPAEEGEAVFSIALLSLLDRAQSPGSVLATAARLSPIASNIADQKLRELQNAPLPILPAEDPVRAAHIAAEYVALLKELESILSSRSEARQAVITPLLEKIGEAIKEVTQQIIQRQFLPSLNEPNAKRRAAVVLNIEILARALGRLEEAGRRAGRFEAFDKLQVSHAVKLRSILNGLDGGGLQRHDVIRIADILLGAEKAMELAAPASARRK
jgi:ElaB/YqjD/DUF883 family membrane-anchored ribosome-binding protein